MVRPIHLGACLVVLSACATEAKSVDVAGECGEAFTGQICTFAQTHADSLVEVGATVALAAIAEAPVEHPMAWPPVPEAALSLPVAWNAASGLQEATFYWEAGGHPPAPFMTPHFDFHFNLISDAERMAIDCSDRAKPAALPAGYGMEDLALPPEMAAMTGMDTLFGTCVPQMGMHALPLSDLSATVPFRGTMVIGFYSGKPIFIEPMITKTMLLEKKSFDLAIPEIPGATGPYPRTFRATWNEAGQNYRFAFSGFAPGS